jgi:LPXTG-motif cell wall-anchored protein
LKREVKNVKKKLAFLYGILGLFVILYFPINQTGADQSSPNIDLSLSPVDYLFNIENLKPGDSITKELTIENIGNKKLNYKMESKFQSGYSPLYNKLKVKVIFDGIPLYEGDLKDFSGLPSRTLSYFSEEKLTFTVSIPYDLGNEYQGKNTEVYFYFYAEGDRPPVDPPDDGDPPDPPDDGDPPDPPDDGDPPDPPDDGDPPDPPDDGDPPDPPDDGDPPDPPDDGDPPDPPDDNEPPPNDNEPPNTNEPPSNNPTPTKPADPPSKDTGSLPQTGEENPILIILSGFFISLAGLGLLLIKKSIIPNPFKRG